MEGMERGGGTNNKEPPWGHGEGSPWIPVPSSWIRPGFWDGVKALTVATVPAL